jgi:hypothetical protein
LILNGKILEFEQWNSVTGLSAIIDDALAK